MSFAAVTTKSTTESHKQLLNKRTCTINLPPGEYLHQAQSIVSRVEERSGKYSLQQLIQAQSGVWLATVSPEANIDMIQTLNFGTEERPVHAIPRIRDSILITVKVDVTVTNAEISQNLSEYGQVQNITYGTYPFSRHIKDGRRLVRFVPRIHMEDIPHVMIIDGRRYTLFFKGKRMQNVASVRPNR